MNLYLITAAVFAAKDMTFVVEAASADAAEAMVDAAVLAVNPADEYEGCSVDTEIEDFDLADAALVAAGVWAV